MTTATDLLTLAEQYGIEMIPAGDRIRLRAPAPPPPEVLETLRAHKAELLELLACPHRRAYHYRLRNGEGGGTCLTNAPTVEDARRELLKRYGDRLLLVTEQGGSDG